MKYFKLILPSFGVRFQLVCEFILLGCCPVVLSWYHTQSGDGLAVYGMHLKSRMVKVLLETFIWNPMALLVTLPALDYIVVMYTFK